MTMPDLLRYPLKRWLIKYKLNMHVFVSFNSLFHLQVLSDGDFCISCLLKAIGKCSESNNFQVSKLGIVTLHRGSIENTLTVPLRTVLCTFKCKQSISFRIAISILHNPVKQKGKIIGAK